SKCLLKSELLEDALHITIKWTEILEHDIFLYCFNQRIDGHGMFNLRNRREKYFLLKNFCDMLTTCSTKHIFVIVINLILFFL
ncbi:hypothetical protein ACJX0J_025570, partial [Zea mays]